MPPAPIEGYEVKTQPVNQRVGREGRDKPKMKIMVSVFWGAIFTLHMENMQTGYGCDE